MTAAPRYSLFAGYAVSALLAFGVLTLWVRGRWAVAAFQLALFAVAAAWLWAYAWIGGPLRLRLSLLPLAFVPLWATVQLLAGTTLAPWYTSEIALTWLACLLAAFLLLQAASSQPFRRWFANALLIFGSLLAVQALLQLFTSRGDVFWIFPSGYSDRVLGPFVYHNKYAQFIELIFPIALWRAITRRRLAPLCLVAAAIMFAGVVAGASRSGFAILLLEMAAVLFFAWRRQFLTARAAALIALQGMALLFLWGFLAGWEFLAQRLTGIDPLSDHRWPIMLSTLHIFARYPLFGCGLGAWPTVYPEFATFDIGLVVNQAHSDWLQWAAEGGFPLLLAMLSFTALLARPLVRSVWGIGFLAVLLNAAIDYPFQQLPAFSALLISTAILAAEDGHADLNTPTC